MAYAADSRRRVSTLDIRDPDPQEYARRIDAIQAAESGPVTTYRLEWPAPREVLERLIAEGLTNAEIGDRLGVSGQAVATRLSELGIRRSPDIQSEIRKRKAIERERRRRGAQAVQEAAAPAPRPRPTPGEDPEASAPPTLVPATTDAQAAVLAAIARTAALIPGADPVAAEIQARTIEVLTRVYRTLAQPAREGAA